MTSLTKESIAQLDQLVQTALVAGIKKIVIEGGKIRGIDEKQQVVIITTNQVPDLNGKQIGISRIEQLSARINLVKTQGDLAINATEANNNIDIALLDLSSGKTKAQFRAASIESVKGVPKNVTDDLVWDVTLNGSLLPTLAQGITAMGADEVTIASRDGVVVSFEAVDSNKDVFTTDAAEPPTWLGTGTADTSFCHKYPAKTLVTLTKEALKKSPTVSLKIGQQGILSLVVNGFDFFLIPNT